MEEFEAEMKAMDRTVRRNYKDAYGEVEEALHVLLGPRPGCPIRSCTGRGFLQCMPVGWEA